MKDCINKISFPVLDISINELNVENVSEIIFYDIYYRNKSYDLFEKLRLNHKVIDSKGAIFKIIKLQKSERSWISFFGKLKDEMIFELLEEPINLDDLKDLMVNRIDNLESNDYKFKWIENVKKAQNFNELIRAM
ncbi:hypothetical protein [Flavobacterium branchiicola]|uniref:Uncharacterized protein n=1 Tax=Flavobacterium branchiicola TaxID=1114875 RepID=A0ABV9PLC8_9FLAO|nr:hypothetical protein [Flavobacterium branchiicola]MBS7256140.1 hypothetical protein [Flavobacterium branchiicola]